MQLNASIITENAIGSSLHPLSPIGITFTIAEDGTFYTQDLGFYFILLILQIKTESNCNIATRAEKKKCSSQNSPQKYSIFHLKTLSASH